MLVSRANDQFLVAETAVAAAMAVCVLPDELDGERVGEALDRALTEIPRATVRAVAETGPLLRKVDAVTIPVPDLDAGLRFYRDVLGHPLRWRNDATGQAGLGLPDSDTELVITTEQQYEPDWLVASADEAAARFEAAGGRVLVAAFDIPVGRVAVVADPFGNPLVLLDLSKGRYRTDEAGRVTGVG